MPIRKFGFELEWAAGTEDLVQWLYRNGKTLDGSRIIASEHVHRYHCECDDCSIDDWTLHAQTDSSCNGEVISWPFTTMEEARNAFQVLQAGALEVDAEPGLEAGMHIHVDTTGMERGELDQSFYEYLRYSPLLKQIASGRWEQQRGFNSDVRDCLNYPVYMKDFCYWANNEGMVVREDQFDWTGANSFTWPKFFKGMRGLGEAERNLIKNQLFRLHYDDSDRHSDLAVRTRYNTWEWRLWNSTRSAWRMELFAWLSNAFMNNDFITLISDTRTIEMVNIIDSLEAIGWNEAADLLRRQVAYSAKIESGEIPLTPGFQM